MRIRTFRLPGVTAPRLFSTVPRKLSAQLNWCSRSIIGFMGCSLSTFQEWCGRCDLGGLCLGERRSQGGRRA